MLKKTFNSPHHLKYKPLRRARLNYVNLIYLKLNNINYEITNNAVTFNNPYFDVDSVKKSKEQSKNDIQIIPKKATPSTNTDVSTPLKKPKATPPQIAKKKISKATKLVSKTAKIRLNDTFHWGYVSDMLKNNILKIADLKLKKNITKSKVFWSVITAENEYVISSDIILGKLGIGQTEWIQPRTLEEITPDLKQDDDEAEGDEEEDELEKEQKREDEKHPENSDDEKVQESEQVEETGNSDNDEEEYNGNNKEEIEQDIEERQEQENELFEEGYFYELMFSKATCPISQNISEPYNYFENQEILITASDTENSETKDEAQKEYKETRLSLPFIGHFIKPSEKGDYQLKIQPQNIYPFIQFKEEKYHGESIEISKLGLDTHSFPLMIWDSIGSYPGYCLTKTLMSLKEASIPHYAFNLQSSLYFEYFNIPSKQPLSSLPIVFRIEDYGLQENTLQLYTGSNTAQQCFVASSFSNQGFIVLLFCSTANVQLPDSGTQNIIDSKGNELGVYTAASAKSNIVSFQCSLSEESLICRFEYSLGSFEASHIFEQLQMLQKELQISFGNIPVPVSRIIAVSKQSFPLALATSTTSNAIATLDKPLILWKIENLNIYDYPKGSISWKVITEDDEYVMSSGASLDKLGIEQTEWIQPETLEVITPDLKQDDEVRDTDDEDTDDEDDIGDEGKGDEEEGVNQIFCVNRKFLVIN